MENTYNKTLVIILGMHRSGTSCLTGSLQQKGLYLGKVFESNPHNLKGNRENDEIMKLNESLFSYNNSSWIEPPSEINWSPQHTLEKDAIINSFIEKNEVTFGFKDPRAVFTLDFWLDGIKEFKIVSSFRDPYKVANSLAKRNGFSVAQGLKLWEIYNQRLLNLYAKYNFPIVNFDVTKSAYLKRINSVTKYLNINKPEIVGNIEYYDDQLISNRDSIKPDNLPESVVKIYSKLLEIYHNQTVNGYE